MLANAGGVRVHSRPGYHPWVEIEGNARAYDATGRREAARHRRDVVVDTAADVFGDRGFEATTLTHIAAAANVSVAYLQGLGTKAEIFRLALSHRATGGEGSLEGDADDLIATAPTLPPRLAVDLLTEKTSSWNAASHRLWRAWSQSSDPELRAAWESSMSDARHAYRVWIEGLDAAGVRRDDLSIDEQTAGVWVLTMAETYDHLVQVAGLTHEQYAAWLRRSIIELVLTPDA